MVIDGFVEMAMRKGIEKKWVDGFLTAMESDLTKKKYFTLEETEKYIYGSAEVIGYMMARIMKLPEEALATAGMLGKAMQYVNFIRDVNEDTDLGRQYLPQLPKQDDPDHDDYVRKQIEVYRKWNTDAKTGFRYIPRRYLIPIKIATTMYEWTAAQIEKRPQIIYEKKVKPSIFRILWTGIISSCC